MTSSTTHDITPTMTKALESLRAQADAGCGDDLDWTGITLTTLRALQRRGFVALRNMRLHCETNYLSGKQHTWTTFTVVWTFA